MTNLNYLVTLNDKKYVVRFPGCGSYTSGQILVFDSGWSGASGLSHAVIVIEFNTSGGYVEVYDPQRGISSTIDLYELNNSGKGFYIKLKHYGTSSAG